jgi:predicted nucleic acid-binding Zn ribbon protein
MARFCPSCGRNISTDARICPYCSKTLAMHEGILSDQQGIKQKSDKTLLIVLLVILVVIIGIVVAVPLTSYFYVRDMIGPPPQMTPNIRLTRDIAARTLTVMYADYNEDLPWSDFEISGDCDTLGLGTYVLQGDTITDCSGTITIRHRPTNSLIGVWEFN